MGKVLAVVNRVMSTYLGSLRHGSEYLQCLWRSNEDCASRIIVGMSNPCIEDLFVIDFFYVERFHGSCVFYSLGSCLPSISDDLGIWSRLGMPSNVIFSSTLAGDFSMPFITCSGGPYVVLKRSTNAS